MIRNYFAEKLSDEFIKLHVSVAYKTVRIDRKIATAIVDDLNFPFRKIPVIDDKILGLKKKLLM